MLTQFLPGIAKISTCEIKLPNFREIEYARKLLRITQFGVPVAQHLFYSDKANFCSYNDSSEALSYCTDLLVRGFANCLKHSTYESTNQNSTTERNALNLEFFCFSQH